MPIFQKIKLKNKPKNKKYKFGLPIGLPFESLSLKKLYFRRFWMVRMKGLEPSRRGAPDPKSGVSANFTTAAQQ